MLKQLGLTLSAVLMALAGFALSALPAAAATYEVKMGSDTGQLKYVPATLTIEAGDTVDFVMNQIPPHNVVFNAGEIPGDSALASQLSKEQLLFSPGESYQVTFPEDAPAGEYNYYCQPHRGAGMSGKIVVE